MTYVTLLLDRQILCSKIAPLDHKMSLKKSFAKPGVARAASPASPGAGLSFDIWPVLSGFQSSNPEKKWPNVKNWVEFQSRAGLRKAARATPGYTYGTTDIGDGGNSNLEEIMH